MSNRKDLLADLAADPKITITTSSGRSYTAKVGRTSKRDLETMPPLEMLDAQISRIELVEAAPATVEQLPPMPSEILRRLYLETYGVDLPTPEEVTRLRAAEARLHRLLEEPAPAEADMRPVGGGRAAV